MTKNIQQIYDKIFIYFNNNKHVYYINIIIPVIYILIYIGIFSVNIAVYEEISWIDYIIGNKNIYIDFFIYTDFYYVYFPAVIFITLVKYHILIFYL
jgi:hypothetical protein